MEYLLIAESHKSAINIFNKFFSDKILLFYGMKKTEKEVTVMPDIK